MAELLNPNLRWAAIVVDALAASGLRAVSIAPGSRSTPLALAFDHHPDVDVYLHLDERSASFFALGMALATDRPVALVCTSGTAVAEFFAALIEARQSQVPLIVLTADRPHELRHSGANQTIDQVKIFGDQVLWSVDLPLPEADASDVVLRNLAATAARAYATADGLVKGPVHLNVPFRKPLEPATLAELSRPGPAIAAPVMQQGRIEPKPDQVATLAELIGAAPRGLIVCGPRSGDAGDFPAAVAELAQRTGYPILADALSGVRFGPHVTDAPVASAYESFLNTPDPNWDAPEVIVRFGAVPTSKWLNHYLAGVDTPVRIHVRASGVWADDAHQTTHFLQADEATFCRMVSAALTRVPSGRADATWQQSILAADARARRASAAYFAENPFDGSVMAALVETLPPGAHLFAGNSLPVRHLDQFSFARAEPLHVYANRGASGIDGVTSSALGVAAANRRDPVVLAIGDVSFFHDLTGLHAIRQLGLDNVTIVLFNNNGGGIFRRLPVAQLEPAFTPLFLTPHGLDFAHAAALFGLQHVPCTELQTVPDRLRAALAASSPTVIEVRTDSAADLRHQRALVQHVISQTRSKA